MAFVIEDAPAADAAPKGRFVVEDAPTSSVMDGVLSGAKNLGMGALKGASDIGATLLRPVDAALNATGISDRTNKDRRDSMGAFFKENADPDSLAFKGGDLAASIAGTAGIGGTLARGALAAGRVIPAVAQYAPKLASALESGGFSLGNAAPATSLAGTVANAATRVGAGAAVGGASAGLVNPDDAGTGAVIGAAVPGLAKVAGMAGKAAIKAASAGVTEQAQNATRDAVLKAGQDAGYVVPPSTVNPGIVNQTLESVGGKAAVGQGASIQNQKVTNSLARKELGLADSTPLSDALLEKYRAAAAQPYREVAALPAMPPQRTTGIGGYPLIGPPQQAPAEALHDLQKARFDANDAWKEYRRTGEVTARDRATEIGHKVDSLENYLERTAIAAGKPDLVDALRNARQMIAKSYTVQGALNTSTGDVSAHDLAKMLYKNKPLGGNLETAARFADAFPKANQDVAAIGSQGVSKIAAGLGAILTGSGIAAAGPVGAAAGALPFIAPSIAKSVVLSKLYQGRMASPSYGGSGAMGATAKGVNAISSPALRALLYNSASQANP